MSSSRDQITFTGAPTAWDTRTASETKSGSSRRPNPPPKNVVWMRTLSRGSPVSSAATRCASPWFCVGAHTSTPSARTWAVQFIGSIVAWWTNGTSYTASTRSAAPVSAAAASPKDCATTPGRSARAASCARMPTESSVPASPSSHSISRAPRPWTACQYVSATTATPAAHPAAHAPFVRDHVAHAGHRLCAVRVQAPQPTTEHRRPLDRGDQHPGHVHVDPEHCAPVHLRGRVEPRHPRADQPEVLRILERGVGRDGQRRRPRGERPVGQPPAGGDVDYRAALGAAGGAVDLPHLRRGGDQHLAGGGARLAQRLPRAADRIAAAREML